MFASLVARRIAVPSVVSLALVLAACTGGEADGPDRPQPSSAPASAEASASPTGEASGEASTSSSAGGGASDVSGLQSAEDLAEVMTTAMRAAGTAKLTLVVTTGASTIKGTGALRGGDDPAIQLAATVAGRLVKVRVVDGEAYVSPGQKIMGKTWLKIDPEGGDPMSKAFGALVSALRGVVGASAAQMGFDKASSFKSLGTETVRGQQTYVYEVGMDEDALRAVISQQSGGAAQPDLTGAESTYTFYLDGEGRPLRVATDSTFASGSVKHVADYTDWGAKVTIQAPPESQVMDASKIG